MEIGITKAVQERMKATLMEDTTEDSLIFCWDTHLVKYKRRNVLLIVNASNRYTIAMTDIEQRHWRYFTLYIERVIYGIMQSMGYSQEQINKYFNMSGKFHVTKTHGKKSVGGINRVVTCLESYDKSLEKEKKYQWELSEYLNSDVCKPSGFEVYGYPTELFRLDMERIGISPKRKPAKIIDFVTYKDGCGEK